MNRLGSVGLLAVLLLPLVACSPSPAAPLPRVGVAMYSGRPDPWFTLTREQADALSACRNTGTAKPTSQPPDGLGFRYFHISGLEAAPLLVGEDGAWLDQGGQQTPVALCGSGFAILRTAAIAALGSEEAAGIPEA